MSKYNLRAQYSKNDTLIYVLEKICNEIKQWVINKPLLNMLFLSNSAKLGSLEISFGFPEISCFIHERDGLALFTVQEKLCTVRLNKFTFKNSTTRPDRSFIGTKMRSVKITV